MRFRGEDGKECPEWVEKRIGDIFKFFPTNSFSRALLNDVKGKILNIHYGDIHTKYPAILDLNKFTVPFINNDVDLSKIKISSYCQEGDIIMADASEDYNDIGKAIEIKNVGTRKIVSGLHTILLRDKSGLTDNGYRTHIFQNKALRHEVKKKLQGYLF